MAWRPFAEERTLALHLQTLLLRFEVGRVVALVGIQAPAVDLGYPLGHVVEEVAVVGHRDDGAWILLEVLLQPEHRFGVEVIRRLVEQKQIRRFQKQPAQCDAAALAS